jgi:hypothetical protein
VHQVHTVEQSGGTNDRYFERDLHPRSTSHPLTVLVEEESRSWKKEAGRAWVSWWMTRPRRRGAADVLAVAHEQHPGRQGA